MKSISLLWIIFFVALLGTAQDVITLKKNGLRKTGRVIEIMSNRLQFWETGSLKPEIVLMNEINRLELGTTQGIESQYTFMDLVKALETRDAQNIIWCGLDFSRVKINHPTGYIKYSPSLFKSMNRFFAENHGKFASLWDTMSSRRLSGITKIDDEPVENANDLMNIEQAFENTDQIKLHLDTIRSLLKGYNFDRHSEGIGMIFFYTLIDKPSEVVRAYLVFFDIHSRNIIWVVRENVNGNGITLEWHWTQGLLYFIEQVRNYRSGDFTDLFRIYSPPNEN